jgi:hypothetical protein
MISLHDLSDEFASPAVKPLRVSVGSGFKAFFSRWLASTMAARQAKADRLVRHYLGHQHSDDRLGQ